MIATFPPKAYLVSMLATRLMLILAILALLIAPLNMLGGSAMAAPTVSAPSQEQSMDHASHCGELPSENDGQAGGGSSQKDCLSDCAMACSAIAAPYIRIAETEVSAAVRETSLPVDTLRGLNPESADPPPRTA